MKAIVPCFVMSALVIVGCGGADRMQVARLEVRVKALEDRLAALETKAPTASPRSAVGSPVPVTPTTTTPPFARLQIIDVTGRATEQNDQWWRYAWRLTVQNNSDSPLTFRAVLKFLDQDGFVVDTDTEYNLALAAGSSDTFTGDTLVTLPGAARVKSVSAEISSR